MRYFIDGNQLCITKDDFVNLQESPAVFYPLNSEIAKTVLAAKSFLALTVGDLRSIWEALGQDMLSQAQETLSGITEEK